MKDPHNYAKVGYSMILVSASLAIIGVLGLAIGDDVLYGDNIQRAKTAQFEDCKLNNFEGEDCQRYTVFTQYEKCIANKDLESADCYRYRTWVESAIFEECRTNRDITSPECVKYLHVIPGDSET